MNSSDEAVTLDGVFTSPAAHPPSSAGELSVGTILGVKYRILGKLGRGGMGVVYQAEDLRLKRTVALKFLSPELTGEQEARERFIQEARAASELEHPNICNIHEIDETEAGHMYIAMAYYKGESLKDRIKRGPLEVNEAVDLAIQLARGLAKAHEYGIIHRDIKPPNILITDDSMVKIVDFGLAKLSGATQITKAGTTVGTPAYMSPEQAQGNEVDHRTDIWSLGIVLYEMLTGQLPFRGERHISLVYAIVHEKPVPLRTLKPDVPVELEQIIIRALEKTPQRRYSSVADMLEELKKYRDTFLVPQPAASGFGAILARARTPRIAVPAVAALIAIGFLGIWFYNRQAKVRWAERELLPKIDQIVETGWENYVDAYQLAAEAEKYLPNDPRLTAIFNKIALKISIKTEPPGARIYLKSYEEPQSAWDYLGISPIENIRLPIGYFRLKFEKEGYETVLAAAATFYRDFSARQIFMPSNIERVLDESGKKPPGMVRVNGPEGIGDFFIDQYEVTNKQFKEFVDQGGYQKQKYWVVEFIKEGRVLKWEEAAREFVDQTGRPGPATWQAGSYAKGQDDYPVAGISWYEAAAYGEFKGKSLPTASHWDLARGGSTTLFQGRGFFTFLTPLSNFKAVGPAPVGSHPGLTSYGAYDMAGNVREWCWNQADKGRIIRGGAWDDATYLFNNLSQAPPFDRSPRNGFRCGQYLNSDKIPKSMFGLVKPQETRDLRKENPISDSVFQIYREQFFYDKTSFLDARIERRKEDSPDWIQEKITFNAAYDNERIMAYLFLPKQSSPPYQTVIYFPGSMTVFQRSSNNMDSYWEYERHLSFVVKNGRAVLFPIYKGTFERGNDVFHELHLGNMSYQYSDFPLPGRRLTAPRSRRCPRLSVNGQRPP